MDIKKSKSILIVPKQSKDKSIWYTCESLSLALQQNNKNVSVFVNDSLKDYVSQFLDEDTKYLDQNDASSIKIILGGITSKIESVDWEQNLEKMEIKISPEASLLHLPSIRISSTRQDFDLKIFIGHSKEEAEKDSYINSLRLTSGTAVYIESEEYIQESLNILNLFKNKTTLSLSYLYSALHFLTDGFKSNLKPQYFTLAEKLVSEGAEFLDEKYLKEPSEENAVNSQNDTPQKDLVLNITEHEEVSDSNKTPDSNTNSDDKESQILSDFPFDPLKPATQSPTPLNLGKEAPFKLIDNTPLPSA